jgi:hypothetical protein
MGYVVPKTPMGIVVVVQLGAVKSPLQTSHAFEHSQRKNCSGVKTLLFRYNLVSLLKERTQIFLLLAWAPKSSGYEAVFTEREWELLVQEKNFKEEDLAASPPSPISLRHLVSDPQAATAIWQPSK